MCIGRSSKEVLLLEVLTKNVLDEVPSEMRRDPSHMISAHAVHIESNVIIEKEHIRHFRRSPNAHGDEERIRQFSVCFFSRKTFFFEVKVKTAAGKTASVDAVDPELDPFVFEHKVWYLFVADLFVQFPSPAFGILQMYESVSDHEFEKCPLESQTYVCAYPPAHDSVSR